MTLVATAAASFGTADFRLEILQPNGQPYFPPRLFDSRTEGREGVVDTVDCTVTPGGISKSVKFSGLKDRVAARGGELVQVWMNDGDGTYHAAGFGVLTVGHSPDDAVLGGNYGNLVRSYDANPEELLERSVIRDNRLYLPQDVGAIVRQLVATFRHPGILYDGDLIPNVGVRLDNGFRLPAANLLTAIGELAKIVQEQNGLEIAWGVRADRKFYFNFPEGIEPITFDAAAQNYRELAIDAADLCTAVVWNVGNTPNVQNFMGSYKPADLVVTSIIDADEHAKFFAFKGLSVTGDPFVPKAAVSAESNNFTNAQNAWDSNADGSPKLGEVAYLSPGAGLIGYIEIVPTEMGTGLYATVDGLPVYGARLRYRMPVPTTGEASMTAEISFAYYGLRESNGTGWWTYVSVPLPYLPNSAYSTVDFKFPPADRYYVEEINDWVNPTGPFGNAVVQVTRGANTAEAFSVSDLRFLCLDVNRLKASAQAEFKTPAQNLAQLRRVTYRDGFPHDRFVQPTPRVDHTGRPDGTKRLQVSEVRYAYAKGRGFGCVVDIGNPAREDDTDRLIERISRGVDKRNERLELIRPSALL